MRKQTTYDKIEKFMTHIGANRICIPKSNKSANSGMISYDIDTDNVNMLEDIIEDAQRKKIDLYFMPNHCSYTRMSAKNIDRINAVFVDLDAGRDKDDKYIKMSLVNAYKRKAWAKLEEFEEKFNLPSSIVVETRNGYQVYWLLKSEKFDKHTFNTIMNKLLSQFQDVCVDWRVKKINQIMRLPYTYWFKQYEGKPKFKCEIVYFDKDSIYSPEDFDLLVENNYIVPWQERVKNSAGAQRNKTRKRTSRNSNQVKVNIEQNTLQDTCQFLYEVSKVLFDERHTFLGNSAIRLGQQIKQEYL
jgi:hypothetical protein